MVIPAMLASLAFASVAATPASALTIVPVPRNVILDVPAPAAIPPPFVGGGRATAHVYVDAAGFSYVTAAPTEAFRWIRLDPVGLTTRIGVYPDSVVRYFTEPSGGEAVWTSFAARDAPWVAMLVERDSTKGEPCRMKMTCSPSLDYISKFGGAGKQHFRWIRNGLEVTSAEHSELLAVFLTDAALTPHGPAEGEIEGAGELSCDLAFGAGKGFVAAASGREAFVRAATRALNVEKVARELTAVRAAEQAFLDAGAQLDTPDPELNRFFRLTRSWFRKDVRILPFGDPWSTDMSRNLEIPVLTASPDYHGVFANDCVQTALEGMLVAPSLGLVFRNDLDVLYRHAPNCDGYIPESVEAIFGGRQAYIQPMRIGQHPEWVVSLASVALLSGDRDLGNRLWPGVELAIKHFVDTNGDGVNEWDTAAYPEQPDTTGYRNGMLYAQAWWVWAFDRAAELAKFLGKTGEESDLRARGRKASEAMEKVFGREDGYGVWLSSDGKLHPHHGHEMIIPVAIGLASPERAEKVLRTMQSSDVWLDPYGPYRANRDSGLVGGGSVWEFMRWQFVQALFMAGKSDLAVRYAGAWARQELARGLDAPESFPTPITGFTGQGYVWSAGRATRALTCGLFGLQPMADGLQVNPRLPSSWKKMSLKSIPFRGKMITVVVKRGGKPAATLNGRPWKGPIAEESSLKLGENVLEITSAR
ncbi:MAG: hypothetical protein Q7T82_05025 [Armatimonadota bacterium]|nr:hypothetical protein [Armatimonadota bacterium]